MAMGIKQTVVEPVIEVEKTYEIKKGLFGLLKWRQLIKTHTLDYFIEILTELPVPKVFVNGKEYIQK